MGKNLAIIPARSGSKGVKDKNIRELAGKPLMGYTIEAALSSGMFDEVMVSTDSEHYADVARQCGASVPFLRSEKTSSDTASSWDAVREVLEGYSSLGREFDTFCLLQPTSPLRNAEDIRAAYRLHEEKKALTVISVHATDYNPMLCNTLPDDLSMDAFFTADLRNTRRQERKQYYWLNGAIFISLVQDFLETGDVYRERCFAYVMDRMRSADIDEETDFIIAEALMKRLKGLE